MQYRYGEKENIQEHVCPDCGVKYETWEEWIEEPTDPDCIGISSSGGWHKEPRSSHARTSFDCVFNQLYRRSSRIRGFLLDMKKQLNALKSDNREVDPDKLLAAVEEYLKDADAIKILYRGWHNLPSFKDEDFDDTNPHPGI